MGPRHLRPAEAPERGAEALRQLRGTDATAVFCYNDVIAIGILLACRQQGLAVPQQLSVVGFDDIDAAGYVTPPLTTVHQPRLQLGQQAMQMALSLLKDQTGQDRLLPCHLVVRESTAISPHPVAGATPFSLAP